MDALVRPRCGGLGLLRWVNCLTSDVATARDSGWLVVAVTLVGWLLVLRPMVAVGQAVRRYLLDQNFKPALRDVYKLS